MDDPAAICEKVVGGEAIRVVTAYDLDAGQKKDNLSRRLRGE
jgi:hypothetical protein